MEDFDERMMELALAQARLAAQEGEIPVGAVLVRRGEVLAQAHNRREGSHDPTAHAEILCMREAARILGDWRLRDCVLYVTLEPCPMCAGAIVQARVDRVVIGSMNAKAGCAGSVLNVLQERRFNHQVELTKDVLHEECSSMLSEFFRELRERRKKEKEKCI